MGLNAPKFHKPSVAASRKATARPTNFFDMKPDTTTRMRVVPPMNETGILFVKAVNHFGFKNEDGINIAPACLLSHTDEERCFMCDLTKYLFSVGDQKLARRIGAKPKWFVQAFIWDGAEYFGPKLVGLSKTTADQVLDILDQQEQTDIPFFCDPDEGHDLIITRKGSQLQTKYTVNAGGKPVALDKIVPDWKDRVWADMMEKIDPRIMTYEQQRETAVRSLEGVDWEDFNAWLEDN
jgi:hypothetical protein